MSRVPITRDDPWHSLHSHFSSGALDSDRWMGVIAVLVGIMALVACAHVLQRFQKRGAAAGHQRPKRLFKDLLGQLPLTSRHKSLLRRIARDLNLRTPVQMLLSPGLFSASAERWLRLGRLPLESYVDDLDAIRGALFAATEPE